MPELGKYATEVLLSYGVTILLVVGLILVSWRQSVSAKNRLEELENE